MPPDSPTPAVPPFPVRLVRHYRENRRKCTLEALVGREGFVFERFRPDDLIECEVPHICLEVEAPVLAPSDSGPPLLLLDATWRHLETMRAALRGPVLPRSLPPDLPTAYPRRSKLFDDPARGLASIEALYAALRLLGHRDDSLLADYRWGRTFLRLLEATGAFPP